MLVTVKLTAVIVLLFFISMADHSSAQQIPSDSIKIVLQKVYGLGPAGTSSLLLSPVSKMSSVLQSIYPKAINKPAALKNEFEYFYLYNPQQLLYQSLNSGMLDKRSFLQEAEKIHMNLNDTIRLSKKPLRVGVHVIKGQDAKNQNVYYLDTNNDNDFTDEVPYILSSQGLINAISESVKVAMDFSTKDQSGSEEIAFFFNSTGMSEEYLAIIIAEFKYAKLLINGKPYILCIDYKYANPTRAYLLPDIQYFAGVGNIGSVEVNKVFNIENADLTLSGISANGSSVTLTGPGIKSIKVQHFQKPTDTRIASNNSEARILGFIAPNIKGKDLHPAQKREISLHNMKGKYVFIDIWSTFCAPCIADFPNLKKVYDYFGRDKLDIIGVVDERGKNLARKILDDRGISWPNLLLNEKENTLPAYLNIYQFPTTYLIDPNGRIIAEGLNAEGLLTRLSLLLNKK